MVIDKRSGVPVYRQIAADIRERITNGEYTPGSNEMPELTAEIPDNATMIKDGDVLLGAVWRGEDNTGPWPGECWKLATVAHGKTVSVRRSEAEAVEYVKGMNKRIV